MPGEIMRFSSVTMDTPISLVTDSDTLQISPTDVLKWLAPAAPPSEAMKFLMVARAMGLNPFVREIHLAEVSNQWAIIVDRSGWVKKADRHPQYDGSEDGIIAQEVLERDKNGNPTSFGPPTDFEGAFLPKGWVVVGGWCKVYRKDRSRPTVARVSMVEYNKAGNYAWTKYACTMITKVAFVHALRKSGVVNFAVYDADEIPAGPGGSSGPYDDAANPSGAQFVHAEVVTTAKQSLPAPVATAVSNTAVELKPELNPEPEPEPETEAAPQATEYNPEFQPVCQETLDQIISLLTALEADDEAIAGILFRRKVSSLEELTELQAGNLLYVLKGEYDKRTLGDHLVEMVAAAPENTEGESENDPVAEEEMNVSSHNGTTNGHADISETIPDQPRRRGRPKKSVEMAGAIACP